MYPLHSYKFASTALTLACATFTHIYAIPLDSSDGTLTAREDGPTTGTVPTYTWSLNGECTFEINYGCTNEVGVTQNYDPTSDDQINSKYYPPYVAGMTNLADTKGVVILPDVNDITFHIKKPNPPTWTTSGVVDMFTIVPQNVKDSESNAPAFNMSSNGVPITFQIGDQTWTTPQPKACTGDASKDQPTLGDPDHDISVSCVKTNMNDAYTPSFTVKGKWYCTGSGTA